MVQSSKEMDRGVEKGHIKITVITLLLSLLRFPRISHNRKYKFIKGFERFTKHINTDHIDRVLLFKTFLHIYFGAFCNKKLYFKQKESLNIHIHN